MERPSREAAFPLYIPESGDLEAECNEGMTLRDYFAAAAMQGIMAAPAESGWDSESQPEDIATAAYQVADAMMEARKK
jgi:hypothetical protein